MLSLLIFSYSLLGILTFLWKGLFCPWKVVSNVVMLFPVQVPDAWKTSGQSFFCLAYLFIFIASEIISALVGGIGID